MRVLVTRPRDDAARAAAKLAALGHEPVIVPLLAIRFLDGPEVALDGVQAILATSANGVRAFARRSPRRDVALFAVGPQTADAAQAEGFQTVRNAQGDAAALAAAVRGWAAPDKGALLHVKGAEANDALASRLAGQGFAVRSAVLYVIGAVAAAPPELHAALKRVDAALFFSPRSAEVFRDCVRTAGLDISALVAVCISETTMAALVPLEFRRVRVAAAPNQQALLECLSS